MNVNPQPGGQINIDSSDGKDLNAPKLLSNRRPSDLPEPNELVIPIDNLRYIETVDDRGAPGIDVTFDLLQDISKIITPDIQERLNLAMKSTKASGELGGGTCKQRVVNLSLSSANENLSLQSFLQNSIQMIEDTAVNGRPCDKATKIQFELDVDGEKGWDNL